MSTEDRLIRDPDFYVRVQKAKVKVMAALLLAALAAHYF
jgi:hypothetical protein